MCGLSKIDHDILIADESISLHMDIHLLGYVS
jgi:hypothetical protein